MTHSYNPPTANDKHVTHCDLCKVLLPDVRYKCSVCGELFCSEECRQKHIESMGET